MPFRVLLGRIYYGIMQSVCKCPALIRLVSSCEEFPQSPAPPRLAGPSYLARLCGFTGSGDECEWRAWSQCGRVGAVEFRCTFVVCA
ncbi:hypothetical protein E2C01_047127 [Portunus trituberculatus]|uniref:Uncharacterized protein n=1 Tax=Portunus trituberculatus TaxID=210409 RepID=A0A5B7G7Z1_PORTR|nr:hypothetical protein [Portunus trituberculatus]